MSSWNTTTWRLWQCFPFGETKRSQDGKLSTSTKRTKKELKSTAAETESTWNQVLPVSPRAAEPAKYCFFLNFAVSLKLASYIKEKKQLKGFRNLELQHWVWAKKEKDLNKFCASYHLKRTCLGVSHQSFCTSYFWMIFTRQLDRCYVIVLHFLLQFKSMYLVLMSPFWLKVLNMSFPRLVWLVPFHLSTCRKHEEWHIFSL